MPPFAVLAAAVAAALVGLPAVYAQNFPGLLVNEFPSFPICTGDSTGGTLQTTSEMKDTALKCSLATTVTACVGENKKASNRCFWLSERGTMKCINLLVERNLYVKDAIELQAGGQYLYDMPAMFCDKRDGPRNPLLCTPVANSDRLQMISETKYCAMINTATRPACSGIAPAPEISFGGQAITASTMQLYVDTDLGCAERTKAMCVQSNSKGSHRCFLDGNKCFDGFITGTSVGHLQLFTEHSQVDDAHVCSLLGMNWMCEDSDRFLREKDYCEITALEWRPACNKGAAEKPFEAYPPPNDPGNACDGASDETNCHQRNTATSVQCSWLGNKGAEMCLRVYALAAGDPARNIGLSVYDGRVWRRSESFDNEKQFCDAYTNKAADDEGTTSLHSWQPIWISWLSVAGLYTVVGGWLLVVSF